MRKLLLVIALSAVVAASSCSGGQGAKPDSGSDSQAASSDGKKLFETTCSKCHKITRAEGYKGSNPWKTTVDRMINENGAKVTPEDEAKIVAYLEQEYPKK